MLEQILRGLSKEEFVERHFHKLPYSNTGGCSGLANLASWSAVEEILDSPEADTMVVKGGARWPEERQPAAGEARKLFDDGYTLLIRHAERHHAGIAELAAGFVADLRAPVDVHVYCTPANAFGFGWHYDAEDVFILQMQGEKQYSLRKNTVNPWPVAETLPADMRFEREIMPLMRCLLSAGDCLYIPNGYWHKAEAASDSISLAVGVMSHTALDIYDFLRRELPDSLLWRQRLPLGREDPQVTAAEIEEVYRAAFEQLGADLRRCLANPELIARFVDQWRGKYERGEEAKKPR